MFQNVDIRVAKLLCADAFPAARKPAYQLHLDLGPALGTRQSSAQLPPAYPHPALLAGRVVVCVRNFGERKVASFRSQVLVLGMDDGEGRAWLVQVGGGEGDCEGLVGRRVVVEGEGPDDNVRPEIDVQEFMAVGAVEQDGFVIVPTLNKRLGVYKDDGTFVPLLAPKEAVPGTILH